MRTLFIGLLAAWLALAAGAAMATSAATLRDDVLKLSASMLERARLHVDSSRARIVVSRVLADDEAFGLVPLWEAGDHAPALPLTFELVGGAEGSPRPRVTLWASLEREALVMRRRLDRGSALACEDLEIRRLPLRNVPPRSLPPPCALPSASVLGRTVASGDVLRADDVGDLPEVAALAPVSVRVVQGAVVLEHAGVALGDARVGERVKVRLSGSQRQVTGRVLAASMVVLEGTQ